MRGIGWIAMAVLAAMPAMADEAAVARGDYLVNTVMACGNCHTPQGPNGPDMARAFAGGLRFDMPAFDVHASNITQDTESGIGGWSDADIKRAIRDGVRPNGVPLAPIMPVAFYKILTENDLDAIVAYLRTVPAVAGAVPDPRYKVAVEGHPMPGAEAPLPEAERAGDPVREGFYLATIAHCMECHTGLVDGVPDPHHRLGAGGMEFPGPWGVSVAPNISSHPEDGIGAWSDEEIARAITTGVSRDGRPLKPPMGYPFYGRMTEADVAAVVAWLRTVPPVASE
ncbi:MAG: cytochrome c [Acuticoccus sp.]